MKLLFDENLSPALAINLADTFPGSAHLRSIGLKGATDQQVWDYARIEGFSIVSKDVDFRERSFVEGFPPKVIWLDMGNAGTMAIMESLKRESRRIEVFLQAPGESLLIIGSRVGPAGA